MLQSFKTLLLAMVIGIGATLSVPSYGWNPPISAPTANNKLPPIYEDASSQAKNGPAVSGIHLDIFGALLSDDLVVSGMADFGGTFTNTKMEDVNRIKPEPICVNALGELELCL